MMKCVLNQTAQLPKPEYCDMLCSKSIRTERKCFINSLKIYRVVFCSLFSHIDYRMVYVETTCHHSQKNRTPNQKKIYRVLTRRLAVSSEPLNSSLQLSAPELRSRKATCDSFVFHAKFLKPVGRGSVKSY